MMPIFGIRAFLCCVPWPGLHTGPGDLTVIATLDLASPADRYHDIVVYPALARTPRCCDYNLLDCIGCSRAGR